MGMGLEPLGWMPPAPRIWPLTHADAAAAAPKRPQLRRTRRAEERAAARAVREDAARDANAVTRAAAALTRDNPYLAGRDVARARMSRDAART